MDRTRQFVLRQAPIEWVGDEETPEFVSRQQIAIIKSHTRDNLSMQFAELSVGTELDAAGIYPLVLDMQYFNHIYPTKAVRHLADRALAHWLETNR